MRMGTYYRSLVLDYLNIEPEGNRILDVGCYDGYFLSKSKAKENIGVDLNPIKKYNNIRYIKGDILNLNFKKKFDKIFAFDVIEHVKEDKLFLEKLISFLSNNGALILSAPSKNLKIFPWFLTKWIAIKKWNHIHRIGYNKKEIEKILDNNYNLNFIEWNAPIYRNFYLPLRFMWFISQKLTKKIIDNIIKIDFKLKKGNNGFLFFKILKG